MSATPIRPNQSEYLSPPGDTYRDLGGGQRIFNCQVNVAKDIVNKFEEVLGKSAGSFQSLNFVIVIPSNHHLKATLKADLISFVQEVGMWPGANLSEIEERVSRCIVYTNDLKPDEKINFETRLSKDLKKGNVLHLIIRDECQSATMKESNWTQAMLRMLADVEKKSSKSKLMILLVSATPRFVLAAKPDFPTVNWEPTAIDNTHCHSPAYKGLESIRSVESPPKESEGSGLAIAMAKEYANALRDLYSRSCASPPPSTTHEIVSLLLPPSHTGEWRYERKHRRNKMVVIRLHEKPRNTEGVPVDKFCGIVKKALRACPHAFEIVNAQDTDLRPHLSEAAKDHIGYSENSVGLFDLSDLPVLVVVHDVLTEGIRLPSNVVVLDMRSAYQNPSSIDWQRRVRPQDLDASCLQLLGRMAGYYEEERTVYLPYGWPMNALRLYARERESLSPAKMLSKKDNATLLNEHPEKSNLFSGMKSRSVLLAGPPQVGKTGVYLSALELVYARYVQGAQLTPPLSKRRSANVNSVGGPSAAGKGDANSTDHIGHLLDALCAGSQDADEDDQFLIKKQYYRCQKVFSDNRETFLKFHRHFQDLLRDEHLGDLSRHLVDRMLYDWFYENFEQTSWRIADVGCGMNGLIYNINALMGERRRLAKHLTNIHVTGYDFSDCITTCIDLSTLHSKVQFNTVVGDILDGRPSNSSEKYDVIVFNRSILSNQNEAYLNWACDKLSEKGVIVVAMPDSEAISRIAEKGIDLVGGKYAPVPNFVSRYNIFTAAFLQNLGSEDELKEGEFVKTKRGTCC